jgi:hypothetical protein
MKLLDLDIGPFAIGLEMRRASSALNWAKMRGSAF